MYMFFSQYEYDLYSIASLIVSANRLAMCTCIIIAVLIYDNDNDNENTFIEHKYSLQIRIYI